MTRLIALAVLLAAGPAAAQNPPAYARPGQPADLHRYQADQHRYELSRLRAEADRRDAEARQLETEARLRRMEIEASRQTDITIPPTTRAVRSPEEERALREAATRRRQDVAAGASQIDAWLDRPAP